MITIGSDPEFGLVREGKQVMAYEYLPDSIREDIGCDGHSDIGELRPRHGETPREHLRNIAALIEELGNIVPGDTSITAGSMVAGNDAIGGHLHFGVHMSESETLLAAKALDYYLALPIALIEVQASAKYRRTRCDYGILTNCRTQSWGFEYRTLPSWLLGWGIALSVLSIGYAVVEAVYSGHCPDVPDRLPDPDDFYNCDKKAMRPLIANIRRGWRELPLYPHFRLEAAFLNHLLVQKMVWKEGEDIRDKWYPTGGNRAPRVVGSPDDQNCPQIAALVHGVKGAKIFIYGLNPDRQPDIYVNDLGLFPGSIAGLDVQVGAFGSAKRYNGWLCIGLSHALRQNVQAAANLINKLLGG